MRKLLPLLIVIVMLVSAVAAFGGGEKEPETAEPTSIAEGKEPIKIGAIASFTGEAAEMGIENRDALNVALDYLNAMGGIHGYPISLSLLDGQSKPASFATKAHRLIESENVVIGFGGNDISYATAAGEVFQGNKVPYMSTGASTPTTALVGEYMFMIWRPDNDCGRAIAKYMYEELGYEKVTIFKDIASAYGTKLTEYFIYYFKEFTGDDDPVPLVLTYNTGDNDYTAQLTRLKANIDKMGIQAVVLPTWPRDAPKIAKQARDLAIDLPMVGTDGVDTSALTEVGGISVEDMIFATLFHPDQPGITDMASKVMAEYEKKFGMKMGAYGASAYDAFMVAVESVGAVIEDKGEAWWDSASLAEKRVATRDKMVELNYEWTSEPMTFTPEGWPKRRNIWKVVKDGEREYYDYQAYDEYTPPGIDLLPFK